MLIGRERERALLAELVERARRGSAGSVVLRGEPGVGKSALLAWLTAATTDALLLRTQGLEAEAPMPYAALHRLLGPLRSIREDLPAPQSRALRVAFGEQEGDGVEPFLVAVATLSVLTAAAEERLVLCVVDDAHWLDAASADVLLFCARRIDADRVAMVLAMRDGETSGLNPEGVPELAVEGLDPAAARALLETRAGPTGVAVADRIVAETRGNPLALLELPTALTAPQVAGSVPLPAQLPVTDRLERAFLDRSRRLARAARSVLLVLAADDTGRLAVVRDAAGRLGLGDEAVAAAWDSDLVEADGDSVRLRHPLVRSALYQAARPEERQRVHRALAKALAQAGRPDRATWHRAAAASGPDAALADVLAELGERSERQGGPAAASVAFARAAELSDDEPRRARLLVAAARSAWTAGLVDRSRELVAAARSAADGSAVLAGDIARLRGRIEVNLGSAVDAHRILSDGARTVATVDPRRALEMAVAATLTATYGADSGARVDVPALLDAVSATASPREACLARMLSSMTHVLGSRWTEAVAELAPAWAIGEEVEDLDVLANLGNAALQVGDEAAQQRFYSLALSRAREAGAVTTVVYTLQRLCFGRLVAGDWSGVRAAAEESRSLCDDSGARAMAAPSLAFLALLAALQGRDEYDDLVRELNAATATQPLGILTDPVHDLTRWARGARALATGDPAGAVHHLRRLRLPALTRMAAVDRIDAAVRAGEAELAAGWVEELDDFARGTGRPWAAALVAHGRALTAGPDAASSFERSLDLHAGAGRPVDEARAQLAYGEWLRRQQRRVDARSHLRRALGTFQDLHAVLGEERAAQELRASGETARRRDPSTLVTLTPMELKVARLVATGMSNKDVAAEIWVSPRTVAFHLRNVFAKTGVTSRGQLGALDLG